jgi:hypothetical protein
MDETAQEQREDRDDKGRFIKGNPRRFPAGQSGNPGGQVKGVSITAEVNKLLKADPERIKSQKPKTGAALKARQIFASDDSSLIKTLWDRVDGKVPDKQEITGKDGGPIEISTLTEEEKRKRLAALLREEAKNGISD